MNFEWTLIMSGILVVFAVGVLETLDYEPKY